MSPHQRVLTCAASAVKSRRIRSARAAAAGSAIVVFFQRRAARPASPAERISRATRLRPCRCPVAAQLGVDPRGAVPAFGLVVHGPDLRGELRVGAVPPGRPGQVLVEGGTGDLQQLARPLDVAPAALSPPR